MVNLLAFDEVFGRVFGGGIGEFDVRIDFVPRADIFEIEAFLGLFEAQRIVVVLDIVHEEGVAGNLDDEFGIGEIDAVFEFELERVAVVVVEAENFDDVIILSEVDHRHVVHRPIRAVEALAFCMGSDAADFVGVGQARIDFVASFRDDAHAAHFGGRIETDRAFRSARIRIEGIGDVFVHAAVEHHIGADLLIFEIVVILVAFCEHGGGAGQIGRVFDSERALRSGGGRRGSRRGSGCPGSGRIWSGSGLIGFLSHCRRCKK